MTHEQNKMNELISTGEIGANIITVEPEPESSIPRTQRAVVLYFVAPGLLMTAALFGGIRFMSPDGAMAFVAPELICLIFGVAAFGLFIRSGLIEIDGWFSERFTQSKNAANAVVLMAVIAATVQLFNAILPEQGLPYWVVAFCILWTIWNQYFTAPTAKKMLSGILGIATLAFAAKYLVLANLTADAADESWISSIIRQPGKETITYLLNLPRFTAGTGYLQFFTLLFYFLGLYLIPNRTDADGL